MKYDIESILEMYEDDYTPSAKVPGPRNMKLAQVPRSEMDNFNTPDLDQGADSILRPGETLEDDFDVEFRRPNAQGGMQQLVKPNADGSRPGYSGEEYVSGYNLKERIINEKKYKKALTEMLKEINGLTKKGYGNVTNIVEKYSNKLGPSKDKVQKYYNKDGSFKSFNFNREQRKIRGAVIAEAKKLNLIDMPDNMIKAVEDYKKLGKEIPRGMPQKIIKANKVPESQFYKTLNKVNAFIKQKKKFTNLDASKKFQQDQRAAALKKYSSDSFERMTRGSKTIQGGHTGDIYNEFVTTSTKAYTPSKINQEILKDVDATLKNIGLKRDAAIKAKDFTEVERLNTKGINLSAATEGYKTFRVVQPDGSNYIYGINQKITTDPMNLTNNIDVQKLTSGKDKEFDLAKKRFEAKQITAEEFEIARAKAEKKLFNEATSKELIKVQKKDAMKNAKISKGETNRISKQILSAMEKLGCGRSAGGRIMFGEGTSCAIKGRDILEKGLKNGFKKSDVGLAQKILGSGKFLKDAVSLRGLFGPAALAFTAAAEAGIVGYDILSTGKSFKEAVGSSVFNSLLGDKTKIDPVEERNKRMMEECMTPEQMGKIGAMESALGELNKFGSQFKKLDAIQKNRDAISMSPEDTFNKNAFKLDLDRQENEARENIQDFNRTGGPQRLQGIDYAGGFENLAEGLARNEFAQLQSVDNPLQSRRGDEKRATRMNELMLQYPDLAPEYDFMEGGIASLNVKK